jgi:hypothetical protein
MGDPGALGLAHSQVPAAVKSGRKGLVMSFGTAGLANMIILALSRFPRAGGSSGVMKPFLGHERKEFRDFQRRVQFDFLDAAIEKLLETYPVATMIRYPDGIGLVPVQEGFPINILSSGADRKLLLELGCWSDDELSANAISLLLVYSLSGTLRVRDEFVGQRPYKHSIDICLGGMGWQEIGEVSFLNYNIFSPKVSVRVQSYPSALHSISCRPFQHLAPLEE